MDFLDANVVKHQQAKTKLNCAKKIRIFCKSTNGYIITFMNNIKWVWHILIRADIVFYASCAPVFALWSSTKVVRLQWIFTFLKHPFPLYISNTRSYCSHSDRNFPEAQTEHKQTSHEEGEKKHRKTKRKGRKLISCPSGGWHPLYPLCHFFLIC